MLHHAARRLCRSSVTPSRLPTTSRLRVIVQTYATQAELRTNATASGSKPTAASLLSSALDQKQRAARREDSAGPFTLGITPPRPDEVKPEKKWSELSVGEKGTSHQLNVTETRSNDIWFRHRAVVRTTTRTTNLVVILAGAGLSVVLIYALTSELFSRNSPTVLYNKACELIKASPQVCRVHCHCISHPFSYETATQVHQYLQEPLIFHNHPPSLSRPRHRNHYVSSQIFVDSTGREHMLLNFYVQGRPPGATGPYYAEQEDESLVSRWTQKVQDAVISLREMSAEEMKEEAVKRSQRLVELSKELFKFLTGEEDATSTPQPVLVQEQRVEKEEKGWMSSVTGLFSGIKGASRSGGSSSDTSSGAVFAEGEVHADLVMVSVAVMDATVLY